MALLNATSSLQITTLAGSKHFFGTSIPQNVAMLAPRAKRATSPATCALSEEVTPSPSSSNAIFRGLVCGACVALSIATASPAFAKAVSSARGGSRTAGLEGINGDQRRNAFTLPVSSLPCQARLPPLSTDPKRCERAFDGNTIGQANGVADRVLDLRGCDFSNDKINLRGKTLSSALMSKANFDGADLTEVVMSKAYAVGASFRGTAFNNAVVDRVAFDESDMTGVQFINTVLSGSTFDNANLAESSFEDALIGYVDIQKVCRNDTLPEEARIELACKK